jgi:predicted transposase/invertase (TIGR01784 family)
VKRDAIFYQLFQRSPSLFFSLLEQPPPEASGYRFESVEVKEPTFRIDGVFLPPETASPQVVFFVEIQFQKDPALYDRFFSESLLYLYRNLGRYDDWYGVLIFASRSLEPDSARLHRTMLSGSQVQRIYLDELGDPSEQPVGIQLMQLTLAPETQMAERARGLIERVQQEAVADLSRDEIIELVTTIAVYKFANLSREEVEAMLGLSLQETRVYQDAKAEGRVEGKAEGKAEILSATVPLLLRAGLTVEQIAQQTGIELALIQQIAQQQST